MTAPADPTEAVLPGWFTLLRQAVDRVTGALNVLGTVLILLVMAIVTADVIGRSAFGAPISGVPEIVSMSIVAIVFLQVAQAFRMGRLTRAEAMLGWLERRAPRMRDLVEVIFSIAAGALIWTVFWASLPFFIKAWDRNTFKGTVGDFTAPVWPIKLIILIGCAALFLQIVLHGSAALLRLIRGIRS